MVRAFGGIAGARPELGESGNALGFADDYLMTRNEAASFANAHGIRIAIATLAKLACVGGGPEMEYFGRRPLYRVDKFRAWLLGRLRRARNTSERSRARP